MEIFAILDEQGKEEQWDGEIVSLFEAAPARVVLEKPVIQRDHGPNTSSSSLWRGENTLKWRTNRGSQGSIG